MKKIVSIVFLWVVAFSVWAERTPVPNLYHYVLDNGLELFVMENSSAPLAYIEIALHAGGIKQIPETAGLFHLYEHMMFKGNALYPDSAAVQTAISTLGVSSWNGSTGSEFVNYYFTVPSYKLAEGMEFWATAVSSPLLDETELEAEKKVVLAEINGSFSDPSHILSTGVMRTLFPDYPWRLDPSGDPAVVAAADVAQLRLIKDTYYVPDNAALFIGGDVRHEEVLALAKKYYGAWKKSAVTQPEVACAQNPAPFDAPVFLVFPHPGMSDRLAQISVYFRGPDTCRDTQSTYAADVWGDLLSNPAGRFTSSMMNDRQLQIPDPQYVSGGYATYRESGMVIFRALVTDPSFMLPLRTHHFLDKLTKEEIPAMIDDLSYFTTEELTRTKQRIEDNQVIARETADGFLQDLRFWWASASGDYFMSYHKELKKTQPTDISAFLSSYVQGKNPLVIVSVNPSLYSKAKSEFDAAGFTELTESNAYWWKKDGTR